MTLRAESFTWDQNVGVVEVSDLGPDFRLASTLDVVGRRATLTFNRAESRRDPEGEVVAWRYVSTDGRFILNILND